MPICTSVGDDIKACQAKGKIVTLSLGGAGGSVGFQSDDQGETLADTVWDLFLGGSSSTRPFGDAVLDGCVHCSFMSRAVGMAAARAYGRV